MKIYILAPYVGSGGPSCLHNLCDACIRLGLDAYICYFFDNPRGINTVYPDFSNYNVKIISREQIEQSPNNWVVIPEYGPWTNTLDSFKNMKRAYWWLSVDNNHGTFNKWNEDNILHLYQSTYALAHVLNNRGKMYMPLMDSINDDYFKIQEFKKDNIICYNPTKDKLTPTIAHMLNCEVVPLKNMSRSEIIKTLQRSKLYMDFGYHPGKDMMPREAGILYNTVITGTKGSAYFFTDVPILPQYKFRDDDIENIVKTANDCVVNYDSHINNFAMFRNIVRNQKSMFYENIKQIFYKE